MPVTDSQKLTHLAKDTHETLNDIGRGAFMNLWYNMNYHLQDDLEITIKRKSKDLMKAVEKDRDKQLAKMKDHYEIRILEGKVNHTILNGLGAPHFNETNLTIHQLYGVPYLPASSLKGSLKSWLYHTGIQENPELHEIEQMLLGTQGNNGILQLMDAFIYQNAKIERDYLTPHFSAYYGGTGSPTDDDNPIPVPFYRIVGEQVNSPVTIKFVLLLPSHLRHMNNSSGLSAKELMDGAVDWFSKMLTESGVGSKTSSGYGRFHGVDDITEEVLKGLIDEIGDSEGPVSGNDESGNLDDIDKLIKEVSGFRTESQEDIAISKNREGFVKKIEQVINDGQFDEKKKVELVKAVRTYWKETNNYKPNRKSAHFKSVKMIKDFMEGKE